MNRSAKETMQHFTILLRSTRAVALDRQSDDRTPLQPIGDDAPVLQKLRDFAKGVKSVNSQASDVVDFVLDQLRACRQSGSKEYPFTQHMCFFLHLLRECHSATDEAQRRTAVKRLRDYIFITSYGKMYQRLNIGKGERKIYNILVACVVTKANLGDDLPVSSGFLQPPNSQQASLIRASMRALRKNGITDEVLEKILESPLYDAEGRWRFHHMLRTRVVRVDKALKKLETVMAAFKRAIGGDIEPDRAHIAECVAKAESAVHKLDSFLRHFKDLMIIHLTWIAHVAGVTREDFLSSRWPVPRTSASGSAMLDPDDATLNDVVPSARLPKERFAAMAHEYLKLICLHESYLKTATTFYAARKRPFEQRTSELVLHAQVSFVEMRHQAPETSRASIRECLERLQQREPQLNIGVLEGWFSEALSREKDALTDIHGFNGVVHCESTLMSFMAAVRDKDVLGHITGEDDSTIEKSLLILFKKWRPLVHISKPRDCCPPCWKLQEVMDAHSNAQDITARPTQMCAPGNHGVWTPFALPAWSPKNLGEGVLTFHEDEAIKKLVKLQHDEEQRVKLQEQRAKPPLFLDSDEDEDDSDSDESIADGMEELILQIIQDIE